MVQWLTPEVCTVSHIVRVRHITYVTPSSITLFGGRLRKHRVQPVNSIGLSRSDGKTWQSNAGSLVARAPLAWDVTVAETYATSHIQATAIFTGAAAEKASDNKNVKYNDVATTHIFVPIAVEQSGAWCSQSAQFVEDLGRRITAFNNEPLETIYIYHRLSVTLQRGNAVEFNNTFPET